MAPRTAKRWNNCAAPSTHPALANERVPCNAAGRVVLTLKTRWRDGATHLVMSPLEFIQQLAALAPRPRLHLIRFHGGLAPSYTTSAKMRALVVPQAPDDRTEAARHVRGELCAPQVGAAELDPAAQARLGYDITCVQVSLLESFAFEIDHEHCPN